MAHELNFENGEASLMYVGDVPWHGLGTRLETAPETAQEAITAAHLDWEVEVRPVYAGGKGIFSGAIPRAPAVARASGHPASRRSGQESRKTRDRFLPPWAPFVCSSSVVRRRTKSVVYFERA
jgi:hypothetical protein